MSPGELLKTADRKECSGECSIGQRSSLRILLLLFFRLIGKLFHLKHAVCFKGSLSIKSSIAFINFIHFLPEV